MAYIEKITVRKTVTPEDYRAAIYFNVLFRNRLMPVAMVVLAVLAVLEIIYCGLTGFANNMNYTLLTAVLILCFTAFILYKTESTARKVVKGSYEIMGQKRTVSFSEENVVVEGRNQGDFSTLEWDSLSKAYELKKYFIIYFTAPKTITVPKEAMDYDEMRELTKLLQKKCGKNFINRA